MRLQHERNIFDHSDHQKLWFFEWSSLSFPCMVCVGVMFWTPMPTLGLFSPWLWMLYTVMQRFHGMSFVSFVAVARIAGRPVSSKSYWVRRPSTVQRTVTQLHRVDDQKAGANGRSRGYLNSLHPTLRFGATSRFLSTSYDNSRLSWSLFVEVWWLPWKNLPETKSSHLKMLFGRWSLSFWA